MNQMKPLTEAELTSAVENRDAFRVLRMFAGLETDELPATVNEEDRQYFRYLIRLADRASDNLKKVA